MRVVSQGAAASADSHAPERQLVCGHRCWSALKGGLSADEIAAAHDVLLERMDAEFETLKRLEAVSSAAEATFAGAADAKEMDPAATTDARSAEGEAAENAQARPQACNREFWRMLAQPPFGRWGWSRRES